MRRHALPTPVVDEAGRLIGVVSQTDILYLDVPADQALIRHRERGVRVGEVMSAPAVTIDETPPAAAIGCTTSTSVGSSRWTTTDGPAGVISAMDLAALVAEG